MQFSNMRLILTNILIIFFSFVHVIIARSPMIHEDAPRTRNKAAECVFGNQVRELGSTWVPNLGPPIGVLYCMKCECIQFQKKKRIVAKVQCRSIKNECPEPTCEEPQLLPGRCCKTCPGDTYNPDVIQDVIPQDMVEGEEKSTKHYAALLTDRSSLIMRNDDMQPIPNDNKNNVIATGRFTFQKKNLYYSFYISDKAARPRTLQFVNSEGTILEEHVLSNAGGFVNSVYQNATRKVCGVWKRLPRDYRRLLKDERMFVVLGWGNKEQSEFTLSGQLTKYVTLGTEMFSSLLEPAPETDPSFMAGAGGTAIVSTSTSLTPSIHLAIVFNGIFTPDEISNVPVNVTLAFEDRKTILSERIVVNKPAHELNVVEISSLVSQSDFRLLTRGRLVLTISSVSKPQALRLSGNIMTKATCELFQTPLSSSNDRNNNKRGTSGLAWLYLNNEGSLVYNVQIEDLEKDQRLVFITLVDVGTKRKTELEDLTPSFKRGWANGTINRLSPKVLEPLYSGNLLVNVAVKDEHSLIRGRLTSKFVADARDAPAPVLMKRERKGEDYILQTPAVGMAWFSVDNECHIHYDISLAGFGSNEKHLQLYLEFLPMIAPGAPCITRLLEEEFQGNQIDGSPVESLAKEELIRLDSGVVFVKIKDRNTKDILLSATLKQQVKVPITCLPHYPDNNVVDVNDEDSTHFQQGACLYEGRFYKEEAQWTSITDPCTMCFCQNGNVKCDTTTCPEINCPNSEKTKTPGECCYVCSNNTRNQENEASIPKGCTLLGKFYSPGAVFHPYLIPNGFDNCTRCVCDPVLLQIKCNRIGNERLCCKSCTESKAMKDSENGTYVSDTSSPFIVEARPPVQVSTENYARKILSEGGCINVYNPSKPYENGQQYHPIIESLGEYKCVTCKCKNGESKCERQRCTKAMCKLLRSKKKNPLSTTETCCSKYQCRFKHHPRRRNINFGQ